MAALRFLASTGSLISNVSLFTAIMTAWPGYPPYGLPAQVRPAGPIVVELGWFRPYLLDQARYQPPSIDGPECPHPKAQGWAYELRAAPLPIGFNPQAYPGQTLSACVRLGDSGEVMGVALIGVKDPAVATDLIDTIKREWYFSPTNLGSEAGWVHVRLNDAREATYPLYTTYAPAYAY